MSSPVISTPDAPQPRAHYSQARIAGGFLFTAGCGPLDPKTSTVTGTTVTDQTQATIANLSALLAAGGLDLSDVVKATVHLQNLDADYAEFNEAYNALVVPPYPVRTTVGSDLTGILVEIDFVAALRPDEQ